MKNPNLDRITTLLERVQPKLSTTHQLEFKNVFGAVSGYINGRIFISCGKFGVALKLPAETLDTLFQDMDVGRLRYFPKGHIKKEYAILPNRILEDDDQFGRLVNESLQYAQSLSQSL